MSFRFVKEFKVLDLVFPFLAVLEILSRCLFVVDPVLPVSTVVLIGITVALSWVGIMLRERIGFALFTAIGCFVGLELFAGSGFTAAFAHEVNHPSQDGTLSWWVITGGLYSLFRIATGGGGKAGSFVSYPSSAKGTPLSRAIGRTWGAQDLSDLELRIWLVAAPIACIGLCLDLFPMFPYSNVVGVILLVCGASVASLVAIRRALREVRAGATREGRLGIVSTSVALLAAFVLGGYSIAAPDQLSPSKSLNHFSVIVHRGQIS